MTVFRHIAVALDLSASSIRVLREAVAMARVSGAQLTALHVGTPPIGGVDEADLREILSEIVREVPAVAMPAIGMELLEGDPVREILGFAAAHEVDLIVLGRRPHGVVDRLLLESVGERVTRQARCSVLGVDVAAPARPIGLSSILCAVDLTDGSAGTLRTASDLAQAAGAQLTVLHVVDPADWTDPLPMSAEGMEVRKDALAAAARDRLRALRSKSLRPGVRTESLISFGIVPDRILEAAAGVGAELVILGAHSRRFLGHTFLGSTAKEIRRQARCPVLLARCDAQLMRVSPVDAKIHLEPRAQLV